MHDLEKEPWMRERNDAIRMISELGNDEMAREIWRHKTGQYKQSLAENAMYRYKTLFGGGLMSRRLDRQRGESFGRSLAMNQLGIPKGEWISK